MSSSRKKSKSLNLLVATVLVGSLISVPAAASAASADTTVSVIVQKSPGADRSAERAVVLLGGKVDLDLSIINGFVASVPRHALDELEQAPGVRYVTPDRPVRMLGEFDEAQASDASSFTDGSDGTDGSGMSGESAVNAESEMSSGLAGDSEADEPKTAEEVTTTPADESKVASPIPEATEAPQPVESAPSDVSVYKESIGADDVHASGVQGEGVTVALIDTGVSDVPDLRGVTVPVKTSSGYMKRCVNLSGEAGCNDSYGHGTFIAGLIAGNGAMSDGRYAGVAPQAKILSVKIAGRDGSASVGKILFAIQWVVNNKATYGVKMMNLSLGTDSPQSYLHDPLNYAVERAWDAGITVVVSAGNRGPGPKTVSKPADDPFVITTGAVDDLKTAQIDDDILPDFSSRGPTIADGLTKPDITAPGGHLISLRAPNSSIEKRFPGGGVDDVYRRGSGTSQSAGVVSGAVALLLSAHPEMTPDHVKYALMHSAKSVASNDRNQVGAGMIDIAEAVADPPRGEANQGVMPAFGDGSLQASQGSVKVVAKDGTNVLGQLGGVIPIKGLDAADPSGGTWYETGWYGGTWYGGTWYGGTWYGGTWYGGTWYGGTWYGGTWYGGTWYGGTWYGGTWYGGTWYGAWD